jgi:hypothetical protein
LSGFAAVALLLMISAPSSATDELPPGYNPDVRPDPEGTPTQVEVGVTFLDISSINDVSQTFSADLYFEVSWLDTRLANSSIQGERRYSFESIWNPAPGILNRRNMELVLPMMVRVDPAGRVSFAQRAFGDFSIPLDLRRFPVDSQVLFVKIVSYRFGPDEVEFVSGGSAAGGGRVFSLSGWHVPSTRASVWSEHDAASEFGVAHSTWRIDVQRDRSHFRYNFFIPLVLIVLMAWSVFWINPNFLPSQIAVSTSSVFTLIAFRFSMGLFLPKVSYMTLADKFTLGATVLVFYALAQAVSTGWLAKNNKETIAHAMDRWGRWIYLLVFAAILLVTLGSAI